jgi:uncharacterized membrane protein YeaQ/YmgE (transglycosylase-associated protein family)
MTFWAFILVYLLGTVVGVLASLLLNVQLRRPGLSKSIALAVLGVLLTVFLTSHNTTMPEWLLVLLWAGIGLLAGLGSREVRAPL